MAPSRLICAPAAALAAVLASGLAAAGPAAQAVGPVTPRDMTLGDPHARVTVIEYASASCPHGAWFNNQVFPAFKAKYVDTGKVRYVFREILTPPGELAMAFFLEARCAGRSRYFSVIDQAFHAQKKIYDSGDWHSSIYDIGRSAGLDEARLTTCLRDQAARDAMTARASAYATRDGITATPTFVIGDQRLNGEQSLAALDEAIAKAKAGGRER